MRENINRDIPLCIHVIGKDTLTLAVLLQLGEQGGTSEINIINKVANY